MSPELQCNHDQLVCPSENITCQCVVTGTKFVLPVIIWCVNSLPVGYFNHLGTSYFSFPNYTTTVEVLENGLSSNLSFPVELLSGPITVECKDTNAQSANRSFSTEGLFFEV